MATAKLTKRHVDSLKFSPGCDYFVWDEKLRGFGIRVTEWENQAGEVFRRKTFVVGYRARSHQRYRRMVLGAYGPMTVEQARGEALRHLSAISSGSDPLEARQAARRERTVRDLGDDFLAEVELHRKRTTASEYVRLWKKHALPVFGSKKVVAVTRNDVNDLHVSLQNTPYVANRLHALIGAFFTYAARAGVRAFDDNPARGVVRYTETARERFLTPEEFARLGEALRRAERDGLPTAPEHRKKPMSEATRKHRPQSADAPVKANPRAVAAIRLLALTGCRESEIRSLRWDAVDVERGYLRLRDSKTGKSIRPLSKSAIEVLNSLDALEGNPYVLPGRRPGTHLREFDRVWCAVRHAAGLQDVRLHDLRHSYAAVPAGSGESLLVVRSLLGHKRIATTERYAHLSDDPVKRAAERTASSISAWLAGDQASDPSSPKSD